MEKKGSRAKKILSVIADVLVFLILIVGATTLVLTIMSKRDEDGAINVFGMQMRIVVSASMEKCDETDVSNYEIKDIPVYSMIFIKLVPEDEAEAKKWYSELKVGDVLTFKYKYKTQETITHRIVAIEKKETGGYNITLEGDNKAGDSATLKQTIDTDLYATSFNYVIGKVVGQSLPLGFIVYSLKQPLSMIFLIIVPCAVIIILEIIRIARVIYGEKKKRVSEEKQLQADEIAELKKQLAILQANSSNATDQVSGKAAEPDETAEQGGDPPDTAAHPKG